VQIAGYTEEEKLEIARHHLLPKQMEIHGLSKQAFSVSNTAIVDIISGYTREAGVRNLERTLASVCRKVAKEIVSGHKNRVSINRPALSRYLGQPRYHHAAVEEGDRVGLATGLAYTEVGGDILQIEVTVAKGKGGLILTGKLGEV